MAPSHHPSGQAIANFLIGDCSPGAALLIRRHVATCARCASLVQAMGSVGAESGDFRCGEPETVSPGLEVTLVHGASGLGEAVFCVRAAPGQRLPQEEPLHAVELLVLEGGFEADGAVYRASDYLSLEENPKARLVSSLAAGCVCLMTVHAPTD